MKNTLKKLSLTGLFLLSILGIVSFVNGAEGTVEINTNPSIDELHKLRLHSLYLDDYDDFIFLKSNKNTNLDVSNGLIVGRNNEIKNNPQLVPIGGGQSNKIKNSYAGIAGGNSNSITGAGNYSAIGGGQGNTSNGENSVIAGGQLNKASGLGVVVGGYNNTANNHSVALGGKNNNGENYSLVLGQSAIANEGFAWNANAPSQSAQINAESGVLIGTLKPKDNISLVVNGAVKIGKEENNSKGKISNDEGCINVSYGATNKRSLGKKSEETCGSQDTCKFGNSVLQVGDVATGYNVKYSNDCETIAQKITCNNSTSFDGYYPYCYDTSGNPFLYE